MTTGFIGWFGPRGVASILYIFTVLEEDLTGETLIYNVVMLTVLISIFAHGISAAPATEWYANRLKVVAKPEETEMLDVSEMPVRASPAATNGRG